MVDDSELRRRLALLRDKIEAGEVKFAPHLADDMSLSLEAVKYSPDGEIDLSTVDSRVRSLALGVAMMKQRSDIKDAASLREIQTAYFDRVEHMFGDLFRLMKERDSHPQAVAWAVSRDSKSVSENYKYIPQFVEDLTDFWQTLSEGAKYHLQDLTGSKGVFGGDLFPSYTKNIASTSGLYLDTIVLTDPFMNCRRLFSLWDKQEAVRMFIKHGLNVLRYKDLATADIAPPIVAILPFDSSHDEESDEMLVNASLPDFFQHMERLFGRKFSSFEEAGEFAASLDTPEKAVAEIINRERLLFDVEWTEPLPDQIKKAISDNSDIAGGQHPGIYILNQSFGRMRQANDILGKSRNLGGVPLLDAPTSWQYLNWKMEYSATRFGHELLPLHMSRGLQSLGSTEFQWLGDIPPDALIEMRRQGALDEIRATLSSGVEEIAIVKPENFFRTADKIGENLEEAFAKHQEKIQELRKKKWTFLGKDIGTWLVVGSIEVGAAFSGLPVVGAAAFAADQLLDAPKLKDLPGKAKSVFKEAKDIQKTPMGLLFRHKK